MEKKTNKAIKQQNWWVKVHEFPFFIESNAHETGTIQFLKPRFIKKAFYSNCAATDNFDIIKKRHK